MGKNWWQETVGYEIYCKSFCDSNGDGIGDLRGVISKLPVLKDLGIGCIWFAPIYKSPQVDNGYDVADYQAIEPAYGTLDDFRELLDKAHALGMRVIMDMVLNHSSDEHYWFRESRKSKDNPYRNYYIWQPAGPDGKEPNNWGSFFHEGNGSAWQLDEQTGEYYLHEYSIKMPDLNWEYKLLREEIYKMLNWWLDFGVDGFRLDVITRLKKMPGFPNSTKTPERTDRCGFVADRAMCTDVEGIHEILRELYDRVFFREDCMTMGEGAGITSKNAAEYILPERKELDSIYHFELAGRKSPAMTAAHFREVHEAWAKIKERGGWYINYLSNHDSQRQVSQHGDDKTFRTRSAKLLAALNHTVPGIPFLYQGEEIGMVNVRFDSIEDYDCRYTVGDYHALVENGVTPNDALEEIARVSRDNARTPYQWNGGKNAGFSDGTPWIKVNPRYREINLSADLASPDSVFEFYKKLITLRKEHPAMIKGDLVFAPQNDPDVLLYLRRCETETLAVFANLSGREARLFVPDGFCNKRGKLLLSNLSGGAAKLCDGAVLAPWEAAVWQII